jgi:uncharacterized protein
MNWAHHRLSPALFDALAAGGGGPQAIRELSGAQYSKHVILLHGVVSAARGSAQYPLAQRGCELLSAVYQQDRRAAEAVIRHPSVGVWARRTIQACRGGAALPGAEPGGLRTVAAAAAIRARLPADIEVAVTGGRVMLPSLGAVITTGDTVMVNSGGSPATVGPVGLPEDPHRDAPGWQGLRRVRVGSLDVLIDDMDPFRMLDVPGLAPRLPTESWATALREAWLVLAETHPDIAAEVAEAVSVVVPRRRPRVGTVSTTSPEAYGAIGMSLPPDGVTGAEMLAHEVQHLKLTALLDIVTLTMPDDHHRYYAPWRDDPRPLSGLLQGTYAYLGITRFWRRQRRLAHTAARGDAEYARWRAVTQETVESLRSSGRLTSAGFDFVDGMARTLAAWQDEPVSARGRAEARRTAEQHRTRWQARHGSSPA